jgi:sarcosine oxidase
VSHRYDLAVVGAGLIGSAAARHAGIRPDSGRVAVIGPAESGVPTDHDGPFASHHDSGRITRRLDPSPVWAELAARSIRAYPGIEAASGISFHRPVGVLWADRDPIGLDDLAPGIARHGVAFSRLTADQAALGYRWTFPPGYDVGLESMPAGYIDPRRMRVAQLHIAAAAGVDVVEDVVATIEPGADEVRLSLRSGDDVVARRVVVAAGAYTPTLLRHLADVPIVPIAAAVAKGEVSEPDDYRTMPAMIARMGGNGTYDIYGVPPTQYPDGRWYLKIGVEPERDVELPGDAALGDWMRSDAEAWRPDLTAALARFIPSMEFTRIEVVPCIYSRTPHRHPIVDYVAPTIVAAAGGNGRAAKSADAIGALAVSLALDGEWSDPLDRATFSAATPPPDGEASDPAQVVSEPARSDHVES